MSLPWLTRARVTSPFSPLGTAKSKSPGGFSPLGGRNRPAEANYITARNNPSVYAPASVPMVLLPVNFFEIVLACQSPLRTPRVPKFESNGTLRESTANTLASPFSGEGRHLGCGIWRQGRVLARNAPLIIRRQFGAFLTFKPSFFEISAVLASCLRTLWPPWFIRAPNICAIKLQKSQGRRQYWRPDRF